jgi:hypothetical protein
MLGSKKRKNKVNLMKIFALFSLCLILVFSLQAQGSDVSNSNFSAALGYLDEAITEARHIDQEELRNSVVSLLEKEKKWLLKNEAERADRALFLSESIDEVMCDCSNGELRGRIGKLLLAMSEELGNREFE